MNRLTNFFVNTFFVIAIVDAANIFTGMKTKIFVLLMIFLLFTHQNRLDFSYFRKVAVIILISVICFFCGRVYGYPYSMDFFLQYTMSFSLLLILVWVRFFSVEKGMWIASSILAYGTIIAYFFCFLNPAFYTIIENMANTDDGTPVIYISSRTFLGINFDGVFYTPLAFIVLPCVISLYRFLYERKSRLYNLYLSMLYSLALFCGGNRACLMCIVIIWGGFGVYMLLKKYPVLKSILLPLSFCLILSLFFAFSNEKAESSNDTKQLHLLAYKQLWKTNPLVFFTGMGAGSEIYSPGYVGKTTLMEWTYLELVRLYGFFSLYILSIFYGPVYKLWKNRKKYKLGIPVTLGCLLYMLSSYGNPYLINSTGFCLLIYLYSYITNNKIKLGNNER